VKGSWEERTAKLATAACEGIKKKTGVLSKMQEDKTEDVIKRMVRKEGGKRGGTAKICYVNKGKRKTKIAKKQ